MNNQNAVLSHEGSEVRVVPALPVLDGAVRDWPCGDVSLVLVTHLLDTAVPFIRTLASAMRIEAIVAIPYSLSETAYNELIQEFEIHVPKSVSDVGDTTVEIIRKTLDTGARNVVLQEIGGYCADKLDDVSRHPSFVGVVEDTKQGQWQYEKQGELRHPVYTIADSPLKDLENRQVGRSIAYSMDHLLRTRFFRHAGETRVGVFGYGGIGSALAATLRSFGCKVGVYDIDNIKMSRAVVDGHPTMERDELLGWADTVLGVSGHRSFDATDLDKIRDGAILASGSSKRVEYDVEGIRSRCIAKQEDEVVAQLMMDGRTAYLLNDGKPINFLAQSVLGNVLDLVYSELYMCVWSLTTKEHSNQIHRLDSGMQQHLANKWQTAYGGKV